jgi:hypothetical protein
MQPIIFAPMLVLLLLFVGVPYSIAQLTKGNYIALVPLVNGT